jgi:hypothetical protein
VLQAHKQAFLFHLSGSQLVQGTPLQISKLHQKGRHNRLRLQWGYNPVSNQHSNISKNPFSKNGSAKKKKKTRRNMPTKE